MFFIFLNRQRRPVLGDSGCSRSCISYEYFCKNPVLKRSFVPNATSGVAINGSDVDSIGDVRLSFSLEGVNMSIGCRVVKGLMDPVILGWDWMYKYGVSMDAAVGVVKFCKDKTAPLIEEDLPVNGAYYRVLEDVTLPPNSKVHMQVGLFRGEDPHVGGSATVIAEPFTHLSREYHAARTCSDVRDGKFLTEFLNSTNRSVRLFAGEVVGYAEFVEDEKFSSGDVTRTEMFCFYHDGKPIAHAPPKTPSANTHPPTSTPPSPSHSSKQSATKPTEVPEPDHRFGSLQDDSIPPGAKPLKIDYSGICEDARPHEDRLRDLLENKHAAAFSKHDRDYGKTGLVQYRANLKDPDQNPIAQPPYRTRPDMREVIDAQAHQMIADGLVGHSTSPYSAPILLAKKKCGGWRFLTDFRKINECCNKVTYPLPRIEDSIQRLENPKYFSSMDLTKGFWQIPIHPDDRKYFAFSTESLHLEYLVAPMGAKNSPSYLSALMQLVLRGLPIQHVISYLDDILVADTNMEDHLSHLDQVLTALEKAGLKLNPAKCAFARESVVCLGHKLSREGVSPDPANVEKIRSWKAPTNAKKLRAFLGLTGYYRQFVRNYSDIARCLTDLTRDDVKWHWESEHQTAFETLRDTLMSDQVMAYPDFGKPFIVKTDASLSAIGYCLTQMVDGKERVISYGSKKLSRPQQRWSTYDREFFALIAAVRANAHYLRHNRFMVVTDHRPLLAWRKVDSKKDPTGRRTRWAIELDNYEFDLVYKKGKAHCDADAMSRRGDDDDEVAVDTDDFLGLSFPKPRPGLQREDVFFFGARDDADETLVQYQADKEAREMLRSEQDADIVIAEVKKIIKTRQMIPKTYPCRWYIRNSRWLVIQEGILYRRSYCDTIHADVLQAVIPDSMIDGILDDAHGSKWSGHPSEAKMLLQIRRYAAWPSMAQDVKEKHRNCLICDQLREQVPKPQTPLQPIIANAVFDHVMCDLLSFPVPSYGFKYVLVFKDVFSGFIRCYKLRDKTTNGVVKSLEDLVCLLGPPKVLSSDNGGEFTSDMLKEACRQLGIEKRTGVPYRPQSQGNVERQNRTLIKDLQHRLLQYGSSWSSHLAYAEWLHNTTPFAKTKMTPYFLFFGREPYLPPFVQPAETNPADPKSTKFAEEMRKKLENIRVEAIRRADEKRKQEAEYHDRRTKHVPFEKGDYAWEKVEVRGKLDPKWSGPIRVKTRRRSPRGTPGTTYECERSDGTTCRRNYEQLKRVNAKFNEAMQKPITPDRPEKKAPKPFVVFQPSFPDDGNADIPVVPAAQPAQAHMPDQVLLPVPDLDANDPPLPADMFAAAPATPPAAAPVGDIPEIAMQPAMAPVDDPLQQVVDEEVDNAALAIGRDANDDQVAQQIANADQVAQEIADVDDVAQEIANVNIDAQQAANDNVQVAQLAHNDAEIQPLADVVQRGPYADDNEVRDQQTDLDDENSIRHGQGTRSTIDEMEDDFDDEPLSLQFTTTYEEEPLSLQFTTTYEEDDDDDGGSLPSIPAVGRCLGGLANDSFPDDSVTGEVGASVSNVVKSDPSDPSDLNSDEMNDDSPNKSIVTPMPSTPKKSKSASRQNLSVGNSPVRSNVSPVVDDVPRDAEEFYTPLMNQIERNVMRRRSNVRDDATPSTSRAALQQPSLAARRRINLPTDIVIPKIETQQDDQGSGEVDAIEGSPTPVPRPHSAFSVFSDNQRAGYLVASEKGQLVVPCVTLEPDEPRRPPIATIPNPIAHENEERQSRGAIRSRDNRSRIVDRPYPSRKEIATNKEEAMDQSGGTDEADDGSTKRTKSLPPRKPNGRFAKKM